MKKNFPFRENGRFHTVNKREHKWVWAVCKTALKAIAHNFTGHENDLGRAWSMQPNFVERSEELQITWLGHATFLIQIGGKNIITDPIFGRLTYIFSRIIPTIVRAKDLPKIDYVLISHNHLDHMDAVTLYDLYEHNPDMHVCVPMGDKAWFEGRGFKIVQSICGGILFLQV